MPVVFLAQACVLLSKGALPRPQHAAVRRSSACKAAPAHVATPHLVTEDAEQRAEADSLRFGFPKGSLQNSTHELFRKAGAPHCHSHAVLLPRPCSVPSRCPACRTCGQPVRPGATPAACASRAGFKVDISERGYFPRVDDEELQFVLFRSQEIRWRRRAAPCV